MTVYYSDLKDLFYIRDGDTLRWYETEREARAAETHGYTARIKALEAENAHLREMLSTAYIQISGADDHWPECAIYNPQPTEPGPCNCRDRLI